MKSIVFFLPSFDVLFDNWTRVVVPRVIFLPELMFDRFCEKISSDHHRQNSNESIWSHWKRWLYRIQLWYCRDRSHFRGQNFPKEKENVDELIRWKAKSHRTNAFCSRVLFLSVWTNKRKEEKENLFTCLITIETIWN